MPADNSLTQRWSDVAPLWEKHRDAIRQMFAPVTQALVEEAGVVRGAAVLDIATGPGEPALTVAALVGPEGKVRGIDPAAEMVDAARRAAQRFGLTNAEFEVGFADRLPYPDESFDAVVSRFGAMFFPAPLEAMREMLRVLKPGGRFALAVWHFADNNPFFSAIQQIIDEYVDLPMPAADAPDTFRFAPLGTLLDVVRNAGAHGARERLLEFRIEAPLSAEAFWSMRAQMSEKIREKTALMTAEQVLEAKRRAIAALEGYCTDSGIRLPAQVVVVSGSKR